MFRRLLGRGGSLTGLGPQLFRTNKSIFSLANEPPHYPSDSDDMGLESISEPDDIDMPDDDDALPSSSPRLLRFVPLLSSPFLNAVSPPFGFLSPAPRLATWP